MKTEFILVPSMFGMISFVVGFIVNGWERRQHWKHLTDFNSRLLDGWGSVKDFTEPDDIVQDAYMRLLRSPPATHDQRELRRSVPHREQPDRRSLAPAAARAGLDRGPCSRCCQTGRRRRAANGHGTDVRTIEAAAAAADVDGVCRGRRPPGNCCSAWPPRA